jgi:poly-gamma-glutamate capsule biosynthesis protein CapA/YwtB (metallophosphatase superfamily)
MSKRPTEISILIASDWAPIRAFEPVVRESPEAVYGDLLPVLRGADLRIVNCECALTAAETPVWKSGAVFKGLPEHVAGLTCVPFEIACLANNHVFDYGLAGFQETLDVLWQNGIRTVGAGLDFEEASAPVTVSVKGTRVTVVNFGEGEDLTASRGGPGTSGWDIESLAADIRKHKKRGDLVIAVGHAGLEYVPFPPPYVVQSFRALVDAGADCVVGHHPHVPQGIEVRRGRPIFYSLGNFVFFQPPDLYYRKTGFCLALRARGSTVLGYDLYPYRITERGLRRLGRREAASFQNKLDRISTALESDAGMLRGWRAYLDYYGIEGFRKEVLGILEKLESEPPKGAAMFRNRMTTLQHVELWLDFLTRVIEGGGEPSPAWMAAIVKEWFTRPVPPEPGRRRRSA